MLTDQRLAQIREAVNGNDWWRLSSGAHLNMAEDLLEERDEMAARIAALEAAGSHLEARAVFLTAQMRADLGAHLLFARERSAVEVMAVRWRAALAGVRIIGG